MSESLMASIITALITGGITLFGTYIQNSKTVAIIETKLEILAKSVDKHNNFAEKIPVLEEKINVANHRISDLEAK